MRSQVDLYWSLSQNNPQMKEPTQVSKRPYWQRPENKDVDYDHGPQTVS